MNKLEKMLLVKKTENGDESYNSTGNKLLDILFMTSYFEKHLDEVKIGDSSEEKIFSMFIRDPRFGLGRRDLGRVLMKKSNVSAKDITFAGRFDDIFYIPTDDNLSFLHNELLNGNELAKKWMPRLSSSKQSRQRALALIDMWKLNKKEYRKLIKCDNTVEYKLSYAEKGNTSELEKAFNNVNIIHPLVETINFEHVPSLAMIKYYNSFITREDTKEKFKTYLENVKKGESKLNISTTNVYDIYKHRKEIDADLFFDKLEKINISCIPILDTSGSMFDDNDSIGKAMSIAYYLSKCSTYCNNQLISFSSEPKLITIKEDDRLNSKYSGWSSCSFGNDNKYSRELNSMFTGDCSNTDFGKVMNILKKLEEFPEYLIVLSDMEFGLGSNQSKNELENIFKKNNCSTKLVWWNFNTRNKTVPEIDENGNIFISGYNPMLLKYLEAGFDGEQFLNKLLTEYSKHIDN